MQNRGIESLTADTRSRIEGLIAQAATEGMSVAVTSARRTCDEQNTLYAQGRTTAGKIVTNARGCMSWHVLGRAADVAITSGPQDFTRLGAIGKSFGLGWGGDFTGASAALHDVGHFEWKNGETIESHCPNPDVCTDAMTIDTTSTPLAWMGVSDQHGPCSSQRFRVWTDSRIEIEGTGFPSKRLPKGVMQWTDAIWQFARQYGVPASWVAGEMALESGGDPSALSPAGAAGIMQILPSTALSFAKRTVTADELRSDPILSIELGVRILATHAKRYGGNAIQMFFAYNAGGAYCGGGCGKWSAKDASGHRDCLAPCEPNVWNLRADCVKQKDGTLKTLDYGAIVAGYANWAVTDGPFAPPGPPATSPPAPAPPLSTDDNEDILDDEPAIVFDDTPDIVLSTPAWMQRTPATSPKPSSSSGGLWALGGLSLLAVGAVIAARPTKRTRERRA